MVKANFWGNINTIVFSIIAASGVYFLYSHEFKSSRSSEKIGFISSKQGHVQIKNTRIENWLNAQEQGPLYSKSYIYTNPNAQVSLQVRNTQVHVDENTLVQVIDPNEKTEIFMGFGSLNLASDKKEEIILNMGKKKLNIKLDQAQVKIHKNKSDGQLSITSISGTAHIQSGKEVITLTKGEQFSAIHPESKVLPPVIPPPVVETANFTSDYTQDDIFTRRPLVTASNLDRAHQTLQLSQDGSTWTDLDSATFKPESDGEYQLRIKHRSTDNQIPDAYSKIKIWRPRAEHFEMRAPLIKNPQAYLDPTNTATDTALFTESVLTLNIDIITEDSAPSVRNYDSTPHLSEFSPRISALRVLSLGNSPYKVASQVNKLSIAVASPTAKVTTDGFYLKPIQVKNYHYQAKIVETDQVLVLKNGKNKFPACKTDCTISISYVNDLDQHWKSKDLEIPVKMALPLRDLATAKQESTPAIVLKPLASSTLLINNKNNWVVELGLGTNYLNMQAQSNLTSTQSQGFSGGTLYFATEKHQADMIYSAHLMNVQSKLAISNLDSKKDIQWRSGWAGLAHSAFWKGFKSEYGVSYQEMPLLYQTGRSSLEVENGHFLAATLGFNSLFNMGPRSAIKWSQRVLVPFSAQAPSELDDFSVKFGVEGAVSFYNCLASDWAWGLSWLGQYVDAEMSLKGTPTLLKDTPAYRAFNSNFQLRLQYGTCSTSSL